MERECESRAISGTPDGKSKTFSIWTAISPETGMTELERFINLLGDSENAAGAAQLTEIGGEAVP